MGRGGGGDVGYGVRIGEGGDMIGEDGEHLFSRSNQDVLGGVIIRELLLVGVMETCLLFLRRRLLYLLVPLCAHHLVASSSPTANLVASIRGSRVC